MTASVTRTPGAPIERTEHPHIVKSADIRGGEPRIEGTGLAVRHVFRLFRDGASLDEIATHYPDLSPGQIFDALSYAYDHPDEIAYHEERHMLRNVMKKHDLVLYGSRLLRPDELAALGELPAEAEVYTWETLPKDLEQ